MSAPLIRLADRLRQPVDKPGIDPISMDDTNQQYILATLTQVTDALIKGAPVIVGDAIAEYYYAGTDKEYWEITTDFPLLIPPFSQFWVEWTQPSQIRSKVYGVNSPESSAFTMSGALVTVGSAREMVMAWGAKNISQFAGFADGADWVWQIQPIGFTAGKIARWAGHDGVFAVPAGDYWLATTKEGAVTNHVCTAYSNGMSVTGEPYVNLLGKEAPLFTHPLLLTLTFLNLKNGALTPAALHAPEKFAKSYQKRRGQDLVRFHTVIVDPNRTSKPTLPGPGSDRHMPYHLVRGTLATYADEDGKRLFGKYSGTYFRPPHTRGSREEGESRHDYHVRAPR